jgi:hypothetical protein
VAIQHAGARVLWGLTFALGLVAAALFLRLPEPARHKQVEVEPEVPGAAAMAPPPEPS